MCVCVCVGGVIICISKGTYTPRGGGGLMNGVNLGIKDFTESTSHILINLNDHIGGDQNLYLGKFVRIMY